MPDVSTPHGGGSGSSPPRYAGFLRRFVAHVVDDFIIDACSATLFFVVAALLGVADALVPGDGGALRAEQVAAISGLVCLQLVMGWLYYGLMESSTRQATVGKLLLGMRVTGSDGGRISFARASGRFAGKIVSGVIVIGYLFPLFTKRKQALHDLLADTVVVKDEE